MGVMYIRASDEHLDKLNRYCNATGLTKTAVFEAMIDEYCKLDGAAGGLFSKQDDAGKLDWVGKDRAHLLAHLSDCFAAHGGLLKKESYFYCNDSYIIYVLFRQLSYGESKMVKVSGSFVSRMEALAAGSGRTPLIALLVTDPYNQTAVCEILPLGAVKPVTVERGTRYAQHHIYRRKNGASIPGHGEEDTIYIHIRNRDDIAAIRALSGTEPPDWYAKFYGEG